MCKPILRACLALAATTAKLPKMGGGGGGEGEEKEGNSTCHRSRSLQEEHIVYSNNSNGTATKREKTWMEPSKREGERETKTGQRGLFVPFDTSLTAVEGGHIFFFLHTTTVSPSFFQFASKYATSCVPSPFLLLFLLLLSSSFSAHVLFPDRMQKNTKVKHLIIKDMSNLEISIFKLIFWSDIF